MDIKIPEQIKTIAQSTGFTNEDLEHYYRRLWCFGYGDMTIEILSRCATKAASIKAHSFFGLDALISIHTNHLFVDMSKIWGTDKILINHLFDTIKQEIKIARSFAKVYKNKIRSIEAVPYAEWREKVVM